MCTARLRLNEGRRPCKSEASDQATRDARCPKAKLKPAVDARLSLLAWKELAKRGAKRRHSAKIAGLLVLLVPADMVSATRQSCDSSVIGPFTHSVPHSSLPAAADARSGPCWCGNKHTQVAVLVLDAQRASHQPPQTPAIGKLDRAAGSATWAPRRVHERPRSESSPRPRPPKLGPQSSTSEPGAPPLLAAAGSSSVRPLYAELRLCSTDTRRNRAVNAPRLAPNT